MEKTIKYKENLQSGAAVIKDVRNEVIQAINSNNSRYENAGYTHNQASCYDLGSTQEKERKVITSTGTASMINDRVPVTETIKSADHKRQSYISTIKSKTSENMVNTKPVETIIKSHPSGSSERKEQYKQSKKAPRYKENPKADPEHTLEAGAIHTTSNRSSNESLKKSAKQVTGAPKNALINASRSGRIKKYNSISGFSAAALTGFDCNESDDTGTQTIIKAKSALITSSRTAKTGKKTFNLTRKAFKKAINTGKRAVVTAQKASYTVRATAKLLINPVVLKAILIIAVISIVLVTAIAAVSSVVSIFSFLTFTSKSNDLNDTHKYITELDADLQSEFNETEIRKSWPFKDEFHFHTDFGTLKEVDPESVVICTDTAKLIAYLTSKYDDFSFNSVKKEIKSIHSQLYKITYTERDEQIENDTTFTIPFTGQVITLEGTKTVKHLDAVLEGISFDEWLDLYGNLDISQKERYENMLAAGGTMMLKSFGSPFTGIDWRQNISSRFGYRIDPVYGGKAFHDGIDISLSAGTEINSVSEGTASVGYDPAGYGNYVTVTSTFDKNVKINFLYGHCNKILVTDGQEVAIGDVIAMVGSTGKSTGSHLHLTYKIDGTAYNPEFYLE